MITGFLVLHGRENASVGEYREWFKTVRGPNVCTWFPNVKLNFSQNTIKKMTCFLIVRLYSSRKWIE